MSRRRRPEDSSLELLLDTICNTFGGIVFLAMLVSLLLTQTQRRTDAAAATADPRPAVSPAELVRLQRRVEAVNEEAERIEDLLDDLRELTERFASPVSEQLARALEEAEARNAALEARHVGMLASATDAQAAAARAVASTTADARRLERAEMAVDAARRRLADAQREQAALREAGHELDSRLRAATTVRTIGRAPRERSTTKREFGLVLKYGRVYQMHRYSRDNRRVNLDDFAVEEGDEYNRARPRPTAGIDLTVPDAFDRMAEACRPFSPDDWHACLVVHGDSFAEFLELKAWLVSRGFEYRVVPFANPVVDQGADSEEAKVQ